MKGQSVFVSQSLLVVFSVVLIGLVLVTVTSVRDTHKDFISVRDAALVCDVVVAGVEKIFWPSINATGDLGEVTINLPPDIAETDYSADFYNNTLVVFYNQHRYNCTMPFNTSYSGRIRGGETVLVYNKSGVFVK